MPLAGTGPVLGAAIMAAVDATVASLGGQNITPASRQAMFQAMGEAIIAHIVANAVLAVTGVTTGGGVATGTIT